MRQAANIKSRPADKNNNTDRSFIIRKRLTPGETSAILKMKHSSITRNTNQPYRRRSPKSVRLSSFG